MAAGLALLGTTAFAQDVTYDYDKAADFSTFKSYAWVRGTPLNDEINHKRIVNAIDAQPPAIQYAELRIVDSTLMWLDTMYVERSFGLL